MLTAASFRPAIAAALAAVGLAALSGCATSFDYATDQRNIIANGGYGASTDGNLNVNGAVIVATPTKDGSTPATSGIFTATVAIAPQVNGATVSQSTIDGLAVTGIGIWNTKKVPTNDTVAATKPIDIKVIADAKHPAGSINLADPAIGGFEVTGSFSPGDIVPIVLTLKNGAKVEFEVPVVNACGFHAFAVSTPNPTAAAAYSNYIAPTAASTAKPEDKASVGPYDCAYPTARDYQGIQGGEPSEPATAAH